MDASKEIALRSTSFSTQARKNNLDTDVRSNIVYS